MSTFMANEKTVTRKWYILDAANKPLGETAAQAAVLLRGKHKTDYTPHVDCGDFVVVINAAKAVLTGSKLTQKFPTVFLWKRSRSLLLSSLLRV